MFVNAPRPEWSDPQPFETKLPPVYPFDDELLPDSIRPWIRDIADRMQVPIDYPAAAFVVIFGGAIGRRAVIQPKARDTAWIEVPNLWGALIGEPGVLKSPTLNAIAGHAEKIERE